jgi:hypothetical protein
LQQYSTALSAQLCCSGTQEKLGADLQEDDPLAAVDVGSLIDWLGRGKRRCLLALHHGLAPCTCAPELLELFSWSLLNHGEQFGLLHLFQCMFDNPVQGVMQKPLPDGASICIASCGSGLEAVGWNRLNGLNDATSPAATDFMRCICKLSKVHS